MTESDIVAPAPLRYPAKACNTMGLQNNANKTEAHPDLLDLLVFRRSTMRLGPACNSESRTQSAVAAAVLTHPQVLDHAVLSQRRARASAGSRALANAAIPSCERGASMSLADAANNVVISMQIQSNDESHSPPSERADLRLGVERPEEASRFYDRLETQQGCDLSAASSGLSLPDLQRLAGGGLASSRHRQRSLRAFGANATPKRAHSAGTPFPIQCTSHSTRIPRQADALRSHLVSRAACVQSLTASNGGTSAPRALRSGLPRPVPPQVGGTIPSPGETRIQVCALVCTLPHKVRHESAELPQVESARHVDSAQAQRDSHAQALCVRLPADSIPRCNRAESAQPHPIRSADSPPSRNRRVRVTSTRRVPAQTRFAARGIAQTRESGGGGRLAGRNRERRVGANSQTARRSMDDALHII
ncbi:hypothetical protein C8R43DRAFT_963559 [Mycena crocata]|nr:hypothetical protein C8R43DRAFT_963559 [Mycena crocata]